MLARFAVVGLLAVVGPVLGQGYAQPQGAVHLQYQAPVASPYRVVYPVPAATYTQPQQRCTPVSARADLVSGVSDQIGGALFFYQECEDHPVMITGRITGLSPGKHGMHVHETPNLGGKCSDAGGHFNPFKTNHGAQTNDINNRHVGDLGNIVANYQGVAEVHIVDPVISLFPGDRDIFRRAIVVHSGEDDLGLGGNPGSLKTGNAGMRLGCGIIAPNNSQC